MLGRFVALRRQVSYHGCCQTPRYVYFKRLGWWGHMIHSENHLSTRSKSTVICFCFLICSDSQHVFFFFFAVGPHEDAGFTWRWTLSGLQKARPLREQGQFRVQPWSSIFSMQITVIFRYRSHSWSVHCHNTQMIFCFLMGIAVGVVLVLSQRLWSLLVHMSTVKGLLYWNLSYECTNSSDRCTIISLLNQYITQVT